MFNMKKQFIITSTLLIVIATSCVAFAGSNLNFDKELASNNTQELINNAFKYSKANQNQKAIKLCDKILTIDPKNEEAYIIKVMSLNNSKKSKEANNLLSNAIKELPNSSILNMQKGLSLTKEGNSKEALKYLIKSFELEPTDKICMVIAQIYSETHEHQKAVEYYTKAIELNPKLVEAYIGRAKDCGDIGNYKCSLENYEILKNMYPNNPLYYFMTSLYKTNTKDLDGAMADIDKAISMIKKPDATFLSQKAWVYLEKKEYKNAIKYAQKALKFNPQNGYTLGLLVYMAYDSEDYELVIQTAQKCFKYDATTKDNHALLVTYSKALYKKGNTKEAIKQIEYAIKLAPQKAEYKEIQAKMQKGETI